MSSRKTVELSSGNWPSIATVCVLGEPSSSVKKNEAKKRIVANVIKDIQRQSWSKLDCVVFPGGFFRQPEYIGHLPHQDRVKTIEATDFGTTMKDACRELQGQNPGLVIVVGVDSNVHPKRHDYGRDQTCVAWNASGIVGIGRKVFPSPGEGLNYVPYASDFSTTYRNIRLPSGRTAILCACYDVFGCAESTENPTKRTTYIMRIEQDGVMYNKSHPGFLALRHQCVNRWHSMLVSQKVNVGITAIHFFKKPGLDTFYQRHGIATCSASLGGGMAVGAAFFGDKLPAPNTSSLVSRGVPVSHLKAGLRRQDHRLPPEQSFNVEGAIVRLF